MYWTVIAGALITVLAAAALGFHLGYVWGWNDRGIQNRARRAQADHSARKAEIWHTQLIETHRQEAENDLRWEKILHEWASEGVSGPLTGGNVTKITPVQGSEWPSQLSLPATPGPAVTGPQDVIA